MPADAATRECREETGLAVRVIGSYATVEHEYPHGRLRLHFFACISADSSGGPPSEDLPERFRWVTAAELGGYRFPPANDAILRLLGRPGSATLALTCWQDRASNWRPVEVVEGRRAPN